MGEVIPFPQEEALRRELRGLHARLMAMQFRARFRALLRGDAPPPRREPPPSLTNRDPGDEDGN